MQALHKHVVRGRNRRQDRPPLDSCLLVCRRKRRVELFKIYIFSKSIRILVDGITFACKFQYLYQIKNVEI